jgi:hypothetical protein
MMPELLLYIQCDKFHCLPNAGGWYDQKPELCDAFTVIMGIISDEENKKTKKANRK